MSTASHTQGSARDGARTRVALVQLASDSGGPGAVPGGESPDQLVARALDLTREACLRADLVALPELWWAGAFDIAGSARLARGLDCDWVSDFGTLARETRTWLHMGSVPERAGDRIYNTSVLFDDTGTIAATYRKIHLFGFDGGEPTVMSAGTEHVVLDTPLGRTGLATCYDLRFPEQFRALVDAGAESFLIASGWPSRRIEHWQVLLRARAIEDLAWVVACNGVGTHAGTELGGRSAVIDPLGAVVAEAGTAEQILDAGVDVDAARQWRTRFPALDDRV